MSFMRVKKAQAIKAEDLKGPETVSTGSLATTLTETNKILVEIQNQLAIDFANRIAEKKQTLKLSRKQVRKKKLAAKENFVEKGKGLFGNIKDFGKKVLSPVKGIFDKIIEFLTIVGTGIAINAAFEWLSDKGNREKLVRVFNFLRDHWKTLLAIAIGGKILGLLLKLKGLFSLARSLTRRIGSLSGQRGGQRGGQPGVTQGRGGQKPRFKNPFRQRPAITGSGGGGGFQNPIKPGPKVTTTGGGGLNKPNIRNPLRPRPRISGTGLTRPFTDTVGALSKKVGLRAAGKFLRPIFGRLPIIGGLLEFLISWALGDPIGKAAFRGIGATLFTALGGIIGSVVPVFGTAIGAALGGYAGGEAAGLLYDVMFGSKNASESKDKKKEEGGQVDKKDNDAIGEEIPRFNLGGTVPGEGPTNVDSVPAILAPKEEVIQAPAASRFRPILKDINNNYGRMFLSFKSGVEQQARNFTLQQEETNRTISLLKEFSDLIEKRVRKLELKELSKKAKELSTTSGGFLDLLNIFNMPSAKSPSGPSAPSMMSGSGTKRQKTIKERETARETARINRDLTIQQAGGGAAGEAEREKGKRAQYDKQFPTGTYKSDMERRRTSDYAIGVDAKYRTRQTGEANLKRLGGGDLDKGIKIFRKQQADAKAAAAAQLQENHLLK